MNNNNVFRLLRIARDKTVKELANELLVTPAYINAIESGKREPSKRLIRDYARTLNISTNIIQTFTTKCAENEKFEHLMLSLLQEICALDDLGK